jgi:hypothetical protein
VLLSDVCISIATRQLLRKGKGDAGIDQGVSPALRRATEKLSGFPVNSCNQSPAHVAEGITGWSFGQLYLQPSFRT